MQLRTKIISSLFAIWAGLIGGISFLEAWLKFKADGVTREIGLGIGQLVFTALNRIELVILLSICLLLVVHRGLNLLKRTSFNLLFWGLSLIVVLQTAYLLPELLSRADLIIKGETPEASSIHLWFILFEAIKLVLLLILSVKVPDKKTNV